MNKAPRRHDGKFPRDDQANQAQDEKPSYGQILKARYIKYEEFEFLKIKPIRFSIIGLLAIFALFWQGAEVPDFENAPRQVTVGRYHCPLTGGRGYGNAEIDGIKYYHDWSRVFGFWTRAYSCRNSEHGKILAIEWIQFRDKRVIITISDPNSKQFITGYTNNRIERLKEYAVSLTGVYAWRIAAMLLALLLLIKTDWKTKGSKP